MRTFRIWFMVNVTDVAEHEKALAGDMTADGPTTHGVTILVDAESGRDAARILGERLSAAARDRGAADE